MKAAKQLLPPTRRTWVSVRSLASERTGKTRVLGNRSLEVPGARNTARSKAAGKGIDERGLDRVWCIVHVWAAGPGIVLTADLPLTDEEDEEEATAAGRETADSDDYVVIRVAV